MTYNNSQQRNTSNNKLDRESDPYLWLEDSESKRALDWIKKANAKTLALLKNDYRYQRYLKIAKDILTAKDKLPNVRIIGEYVYNIWQDDDNTRGLWRRATLNDYEKPDPNWEILLDINALPKEEEHHMVLQDFQVLEPNQNRCLLFLSPGGSDACIVQEFDLKEKVFVDMHRKN